MAFETGTLVIITRNLTANLVTLEVLLYTHSIVKCEWESIIIGQHNTVKLGVETELRHFC